MKYTVFLLVIIGLVGVYSQTATQFRGTFRISNDPNTNGVLTGTVNYDFVGKKYRFDYNLPSGVVSEFIDFNAKLRYLRCSTCATETYQSVMPRFQPGTASGGPSVTVGGNTCSETLLNDPANPVSRVYQFNGLPCRAVFTNGKIIDFTGLSALDTSQFVITSWACPGQTCNKMIDFVMVFDESGSIAGGDFGLMKNFAVSIANNYVFGVQNTGMGLVMFSSNARLAVPISFIKSSFVNGVTGVSQRGGSTCIGCGIQSGRNEINTRGRRVTSIMIVLTDGQNNVDTGAYPGIIAGAKAAGILFFGIGVSQASPSFINALSSTIPGVQTSFPSIPTFSQLAGIVNNLVVATCVDIPGNPCGSTCRGFCSCGGICVCPSLCDDGNSCTQDTCTTGIGGNGCVYPSITCNDGNACTADFCDPQQGCRANPITCSPPDRCTNVTCNPSVGCQTFPINCDDNDVCTSDGCNPGTGCTHATISCDLCRNPVPVVCPPIPCFINRCNVSNGQCQRTPINCDDGNPCSTDTCNPTTGQCEYSLCNDNDACTYDVCTVTGCQFVAFNLSVDCNDFNDCTNDTCNRVTGCQHANVSCFDNDPCTNDTCFSVGGCLWPPFNCLSIPRIANLLGDCYQALCAKERGGCYLDQLPGTSVDTCGVCNGKNECVLVPIPSEVPFVIGGVLLAIIIIASIIICAALGILGGKKGYDVWVAHRNNMQGASKNPLYADGGLTGTSALYTAE